MESTAPVAQGHTQTPMRVYVILFIGMLSVSFASVLIRLAQIESVPSILIAASRVFLAALVLTPITVTKYWHIIRKIDLKDLGLALLAGLLLAIHFVTWVTSLEHTSVLLSTVFVTSSPIWVAILESIVLRLRLPKMVVMGLGLAIGGSLLIGLSGQAPVAGSEGQNDFLGGGLSLMGALSVSVYLIIGRKLGGKMPLVPYVWLVYGCAGLILMGSVLALGIPVTGYSTTGYLSLIGLTVFPQLIGHTVLNYAMKYLPATIVSMVTQLEPIGSSVLAFLIFAELPMPLQMVGSAIILIGVMLANFGQTGQKEKSG